MKIQDKFKINKVNFDYYIDYALNHYEKYIFGCNEGFYDSDFNKLEIVKAKIRILKSLQNINWN